jgi:asparagine synthase (glutamine-hydrolysing)
MRQMTDTLTDRGPDSSGTWVDQGGAVGFGHRRLAIIDLSPAGHQPMVSRDGLLVITFNGEIYNYHELRTDLLALGIRFRGNSDTEVLLEACRQWGVVPTLRRLNGIFAFALWDKNSGTLTLARDHMGVKPLYWTEFGGSLIFGSQLKALRAFPLWRPEVDRSALALYHKYGYIPTPHSIYRGVRKLPPGSILTWRPGEALRETQYWDIRETACRGQEDPITLDFPPCQ